MKMSTCTVSGFGNRETGIKGDRWKLLKASIKALNEKDVKFATFPGGYLCAENKKHAEKIARKVHDLAVKHEINIAMSIDTKEKFSDDFEKELDKAKLPFFACVALFDNEKPILWPQRSITSKSNIGRNNIYKLYEKERTIEVHSKKIEVLMCGEVFNPIIRKSIIDRKVDLVVNLAHTSNPTYRFWNPAKILAKEGIPNLCSIHTGRKDAVKFCYNPCKTNGFTCDSTREVHIPIDGKPHLEHVVWNCKKEKLLLVPKN